MSFQAYGIVWRAIDKKSKTELALKKIFDAFQNKTDAQRTYREIFYLQRFGEHPNIIKLLNIHRAINSNDIYLVFEYMGKCTYAWLQNNLVVVGYLVFVYISFILSLDFHKSLGQINTRSSQKKEDV